MPSGPDQGSLEGPLPRSARGHSLHVGGQRCGLCWRNKSRSRLRTEMDEVAKDISQEHVAEGIVPQSVGLPVPQVMDVDVRSGQDHWTTCQCWRSSEEIRARGHCRARQVGSTEHIVGCAERNKSRCRRS